MISEETLKRICNVFIGDEEEFYARKSGPQIVSFFNNYFKQDDSYGQGFPSRWIFVYNKLIMLFESDQIDEFFIIILSSKFLMKEHDCTQVDASEWSEKAYGYFNKLLKVDSYALAKSGNKVYLIEEDSDYELIGSGGFANVYYQKSTGLVVKKLKEDFLSDSGIRSRFKREYRITKELEDLEGIITVFDFNENEYSYSMERAEETLYGYIEKRTLPIDTKIKCIKIVLRIMKSVHERNVIHRDISPTNIFILHGKMKIADFGLGKDLNMFTSHQTIHTQAVGQYYFCAPEQFMMLRDGDKRSDVYSLGRIINYVMTGNPVDSHHEFRSVAEKATNSDAAYRYESAGQLLGAFEKSVEYNATANKTDVAKRKIGSGIYDSDVEAYLYELSAKEICRNLITKLSKFDQALIRFMNDNDEKANHIIQSVESVYREECKTFESNDPIAKFACLVLKGNFSYTINEAAAIILHNIAFDVNRFSAQHLVEEILDMGVEPMLEDILKSNSKQKWPMEMR